MSKISEGVSKGEKKLSMEDFKQGLREQVVKHCGRYETLSGKTWAELFLRDEKFIYRRGELESPQNDSETELTEEKAALALVNLMAKNFVPVFEASTEEQVAIENKQRIAGQTLAEREGWLGNYYKGDEFFRVNQFVVGLFYIETGYKDTVTSAWEGDEYDARSALRKAERDGFTREGGATKIFTSIEAFGIELDTIEANAEREFRVEQDAKDAGLLPQSILDLFK